MHETHIEISVESFNHEDGLFAIVLYTMIYRTLIANENHAKSGFSKDFPEQ